MTKKQQAARAERMLADALLWLMPGVVVDYHSIIGGPVTEAGLAVLGKPFILGGHSAVVALKGKSGVVAVEAVTPALDI